MFFILKLLITICNNGGAYLPRTKTGGKGLKYWRLNNVCICNSFTAWLTKGWKIRQLCSPNYRNTILPWKRPCSKYKRIIAVHTQEDKNRTPETTGAEEMSHWEWVTQDGKSLMSTTYLTLMYSSSVFSLTHSFLCSFYNKCT